MISRRAVRDFLERKLADSDRAKRFSVGAINKKFRNEFGDQDFAFTPYHIQKVCLLLAKKYGSYFFSLDMGLGKTKLMIDYLRYVRREINADARMLVLVPNSTNVYEWEDQTEEHGIDIDCAGLGEGMSKQDRENAVWGDSPIVASTYNGIMKFLCTKGAKGMTPNKSRCDKVAKNFDILTLDESTCVRNHSSLWYRMAWQLSRRLDHRFCLTGTPFGNDPEHLWSQFKIVDHGITLGDTLGMYRAAFFTEKRGYWKMYEYEFDRTKTRKLKKTLKNRSIRYKISDAMDLPDAIGGISTPRGVPEVRRVVFSDEIWDYYREIQQELEQSRGNWELMENTYVRQRQLTAGYLEYLDPEGDRQLITFKENPKLDAVVDFVKEVGSSYKIILWHDYRLSGKIIAKRLNKEKIKFAHIHGKSANKKQAARSFKKDKKTSVLLLQTQAGSYGLNLQVANYMGFFETNTDPIVRKQGERRIYRKGQNLTCFIYDFVVQNSKDEDIVQSLAKGEDFFKKLIEGKHNRKRRERRRLKHGV